MDEQSTDTGAGARPVPARRSPVDAARRGRRRSSGGRRAARLVVAVAAVLTSSGAAVDAAPPPTGLVRFGHFAPSVDAVDLYVDDSASPAATDVAFKTATAYLSLPAGLHVFSLLPAGQAGADPVATVSTTVPDGGAITIGAVTTLDGVATQTYTDVLATPDDGQALVRFINATPDAPAVDVQVMGGPMIAVDVPYPEATEYRQIAPGTYPVDIADADTGEVVLMVDGWTVDPGTQATIVIVQGADGQVDVAPLVDAAAMSLPPVGGVQTDLGRSTDPVGTADRTVREAALVASLAVALLGASWLVVARSRRRHAVVRGR